MASKKPLLAKALFARSIKVFKWQPAPQYPWSTSFRKKNLLIFFEIHRTSDTSMGSVALSYHAYGLSANSTSY